MAEERSGVARIHAGDAVALLDAPPEDRFGDAVLGHHDQLARFAFMLCGDAEVAEDAVTESYARLWPRFRRGRIEQLLPHLIRAVIVEVRERTRRTGARAVAGRGTPARRPSETPWDALQHLPIDQRSAVALHVVEGISVEESATLLGVPVGIATTRIDVGMDRIAELLVTSASSSGGSLSIGGSHA